MLTERDLLANSDLTPDLQDARKINFATYDRAQAQLAGLSPSRDASKIEQLRALLRELNDERERLAERIRQNSPGYAALKYPLPLDQAGTRKTLDPGTALLSYSVGKDQTILFVIQPVGEEPGLSVFKLSVGEKDLRTKVESFRARIFDRHSANAESVSVGGQELYDLLLKPAEVSLARSKRLLVVPDGSLHSLPFGALVRNKPVCGRMEARSYGRFGHSVCRIEENAAF